MSSADDMWNQALEHAQRLAKLNRWCKDNGIGDLDFNQLMQLDRELKQLKRDLRK